MAETPKYGMDRMSTRRAIRLLRQHGWALALSAVILADSAFTVFIGGEASPIILWVMGAFGLDLTAAMTWRLAYCLPLVCVVGWAGRSKQVLAMYLSIYIASAGFVLL